MKTNFQINVHFELGEIATAGGEGDLGGVREGKVDIM